MARHASPRERNSRMSGAPFPSRTQFSDVGGTFPLANAIPGGSGLNGAGSIVQRLRWTPNSTHPIARSRHGESRNTRMREGLVPTRGKPDKTCVTGAGVTGAGSHGRHGPQTPRAASVKAHGYRHPLRESLYRKLLSEGVICQSCGKWRQWGDQRFGGANAVASPHAQETTKASGQARRQLRKKAGKQAKTQPFTCCFFKW